MASSLSLVAMEMGPLHHATRVDLLTAMACEDVCIVARQVVVGRNRLTSMTEIVGRS